MADEAKNETTTEAKGWREWVKANPWPAVAAFAIAVVGAIVFMSTAPPRVWDLIERLPIESWIGVGLMVAGWGGSVAAGSLFRRAPAPAKVVERVTPVVALLLVAIAIPVPGCGAGALAAHARASSILVVALEGADDLADHGGEIAVNACSDDASCEDHVVETTEAIDAAIASAAIPVGAYVQAIELALAGGEDADVVSALAVVLARALAAWDELVPLFVPLGVDLPRLPESLRALVSLLAPAGGRS